MNVWIIRNAGTEGETKWAAYAGASGDLIRLHDVDIRRGDWLTSDIWEEPRVATRVNPETDMSGRVIGRKVSVVSLSEWLEQHQSQPSSIHQTVYGSVGNMAGHDVVQTEITFVMLLSGMERAVAEAEIPAEEKASLLSKIRDLINNPWISGVGTSLTAEILKKAAGLG